MAMTVSGVLGRYPPMRSPRLTPACQGVGATRDLVAELAVGQASGSAELVFEQDRVTVVVEPQQVAGIVERHAVEPLGAEHALAADDASVRAGRLDADEFEQFGPETVFVLDRPAA